MNLIGEKVGNILEPMNTGHNFLNRTPMAQTLRPIINKWSLIKLKGFYKTKVTIIRTNWEPIVWEKIFTIPTSGRDDTQNI